MSGNAPTIDTSDIADRQHAEYMFYAKPSVTTSPVSEKEVVASR